MAKKHRLKCENCEETSEVKKSQTLLGFPRWNCPKCKKEHIEPLTSGYRNGYIGLVCIAVAIFIYCVFTGRTFAPGILIICALIALYKDGKMKKALNNPEPIQTQTVSVASKDSTFCAQCGAKLDKGTKFCQDCGAKVES